MFFSGRRVQFLCFPFLGISSLFEQLNMGPHQAPLLIASLLLCIGSASRVSAQDGCPPSSCGNLEIRYPFRFKDDKPTCGDRRYELTCDGNRTILDFNSGKYYVKSFYYHMYDGMDSGFMEIIDVGSADGGGCALPSKTLSPLSLDTISHDERFHLLAVNEVSLVNCTREIQDKDGYNRYRYVPVPCLSGSNAFLYVAYTSTVEGLAPSCRVLEIRPYRFILSWVIPSSCGPVSFVIKGCYLNTIREPDLHFMYRENNDLYFGPLAFQHDFLACLNSRKRCRFNSVIFLLIKGFIVLIDVLSFLALARILARLVLLILAVFALLLHKYREMRLPADAVEKFLINQQSLTPTRYAYTDIIVMTRNFKDKIGQGGFGSVYKGKLPGGFQVAIKILGNSKCNGDDFISEVSTIGTIHHINIVRLVGFCSEGSKRALVYEYLPKGSLDKYIFSSEPANQRPFTLDKLIDIALGVARGIDYLHQGCNMRILHFDIKPQNILLDNCFSPKVSDFGLAKLFPKDYSMVTLSAARGTIGYIAPEQVSRSFGIISYKSDVYSFGMLLMEMAGGRRNVEPKAENTSQIYYPSWIYEQLDDQRGMHGIVRDVAAIGEIERKLSIVGLWCIQTRPSQRPSMSRVIEMLQAEVGTLQMPPKPFISAERVPSMPIRDPSTKASSSTLTVISEHESHI